MEIRTEISANDLRSKLQYGEVSFEFIKKDGSLRKVKGTLNLNDIPSEHHPTGLGVSIPSTLKFYDLGINEWRSALISTKFYLVETKED